MPLLLLGLPFKSKRHYTSELGSKPEVVISLSRIGESPYFVCRIRQDDSPVYLYHDQNLNHNMNNLKQHLLHVVNIIQSIAFRNFRTRNFRTSFGCPQQYSKRCPKLSINRPAPICEHLGNDICWPRRTWPSQRPHTRPTYTKSWRPKELPV